ncbi:hypothetical protein [Oricola cellulosilytica]|uniref:Uncharacterized protein n=1 Tax=Oricola cellulosilytica TaxID=1429082 RepID=A0A4R0P679_9HYPH|nr:hypothetical protein [Oricola cellulosilytica]TCD10970.1 hypothetical protein E0D97_17620 [Oricola cellulosilytica]
MTHDNAKTLVLGLLLGTVGMSIGLMLATGLQVTMAPPITLLPFPVVNMSWALMLFLLVSRDMRTAYFGTVVLGVSVAGFPLLVFSSALGPAPEIRPAHFVGVTTDIVLGLGLAVVSGRALLMRA